MGIRRIPPPINWMRPDGIAQGKLMLVPKGRQCLAVAGLVCPPKKEMAGEADLRRWNKAAKLSPDS